MLEKSFESPLDSKIKPVNPEGNQPWTFFGRTDAEAETPLLWPTPLLWLKLHYFGSHYFNVKNQLIGKDPDAGKDGGQEEKGTTEDEMVGWHHWFNGHEFEQAPGDGEGQGSLACCSPRGRKVLDAIEWLNNNNRKQNSSVLLQAPCQLCWFSQFILK